MNVSHFFSLFSDFFHSRFFYVKKKVYIYTVIKAINNMTNQKHPNGYLPKIAYHMASDNHEAVAHFFNRQAIAYGPITPENMEFITKEVNKIKRIWAAEEREFNSHLSINRF